MVMVTHNVVSLMSAMPRKTNAPQSEVDKTCAKRQQRTVAINAARFGQNGVLTVTTRVSTVSALIAPEPPMPAVHVSVLITRTLLEVTVWALPSVALEPKQSSKSATCPEEMSNAARNGVYGRHMEVVTVVSCPCGTRIACAVTFIRKRWHDEHVTVSVSSLSTRTKCRS